MLLLLLLLLMVLHLPLLRVVAMPRCCCGNLILVGNEWGSSKPPKTKTMKRGCVVHQ